MIMVLGSFVSNAFVPLRGLPGWLATISAWNPVSSVVAVGVLALVLLVTVTASSRVYRRAVAG